MLRERMVRLPTLEDPIIKIPGRFSSEARSVESISCLPKIKTLTNDSRSSSIAISKENETMSCERKDRL